MPDEIALARGWFVKAESDLYTAQQMLKSDGPYDTTCFHAQQAVEKYLKGLLAFRNQPFQRTHNLEELQRVGEALPSWPLTGLDLTELSSYAVEVRYDFDFWPDQPIAKDAVTLAEKVRTLVLSAVPQPAHP